MFNNKGINLKLFWPYYRYKHATMYNTQKSQKFPPSSAIKWHDDGHLW